MVFVIWDHWKSHISNELQTLYNNHIAADVILKTGLKECKVHSFILCLFSKYLQTILNAKIAEAECELPIIISFADFSYESVHCITSFMYCGEVSVNENCLEEVVSLSKLLSVKGLEDLGGHVDPFENLLNVNFFTGLPDDEWVEDLINNKKISAEIIRLPKFCSSDEVSFNDTYSDDDTPSQKRSGKKSQKSRKKQEKNRSSSYKSNSHMEIDEDPLVSFRHFDIYSLKNELWKEIDKHTDQKFQEKPLEWPLKRLGVDVLPSVLAKDFCMPDSRKRFRREMSFFWYHIFAIPRERRQNLIFDISDNAVMDVYVCLLRRSKLVDVMKENDLSPMEMCAIIMMLLISDKLSVHVAVSTFGITFTKELLKERLEIAFKMFQTTEMYPQKIANLSWIPPVRVKREIASAGLKKNAKLVSFKSSFKKVYCVCSEGDFDRNSVLSEFPEAEQYIEEFESIFAYHTGKDISLPLPEYEMRMENALATLREDRMSLGDAAKEHMVSQSELDQRRMLDVVIVKTYEIKFPKKRSCKIRTDVHGRTSTLQEDLISATRCANGGMLLEEVFKTYILNRRNQRIVEYNVHRKDAPVDVPYTERFKKAVEDINLKKKTTWDAAQHYIVSLESLRIFSLESIAKTKLRKVSSQRNVLLNKSMNISEIFGASEKINEDLEKFSISYEAGVGDTFEMSRRTGLKSNRILEKGEVDPETPSPRKRRKFLETPETAVEVVVDGSDTTHQQLPPKIKVIDKNQVSSPSNKLNRKECMAKGAISPINKASTIKIDGVPIGIVKKANSSERIPNRSLELQRKVRQILARGVNNTNVNLEKVAKPLSDKNVTSIETKEKIPSYETSEDSACDTQSKSISKDFMDQRTYDNPTRTKFLKIELQKDFGSENVPDILNIKLKNVKKKTTSLETKNTTVKVNTPQNDSTESLDKKLQEFIQGCNSKDWDQVMLKAIRSANNGTPLEYVFEKEKISKECDKRIVKYNVNSVGTPLNKSYEARFKMAVDLVQKCKISATEAANRCIVIPSMLIEYLKMDKFPQKSISDYQSEQSGCSSENKEPQRRNLRSGK